jgi:hypothetical protein
MIDVCQGRESIHALLRPRVGPKVGLGRIYHEMGGLTIRVLRLDELPGRNRTFSL